MTSYDQLRDVGVLTPNDVSNLCRQIHARYRADGSTPRMLPHIKKILADLKADTLPGHPLASVHLLSCLKDMQEFELSNSFWAWLIHQDESFCDARTYGAAIECFAYQGASLREAEELWEEALERYATTTVPSVAKDTGRGVPVMLLQGIITARLFHGDWRAAYDGFDVCVRLYPTLTPARIYELFIYERPVTEAYIVFLMACRAGTPPKPGVLTPLLKEVWLMTHDVRAMIRLMYTFAGAGGKPNVLHLNTLLSGVLGSFPHNLTPDHPEFEKVYKSFMNTIRELISAFDRMNVPVSSGTFNTIISLGGKLKRPELVRSGLRELIAAGLQPTMVTYRALLNAVGDLGDGAMLTETWNQLKSGRHEFNVPWDIKDWLALIRACIGTGRADLVLSELEQEKYELGYELHRKILTALDKAQLSSSSSSTASPSSPLSTDLEKTKNLFQQEVKYLSQIFSTPEIHDFTTAPPSLFSLLPGDSPANVTLSATQELELEELYRTLSPPSPHGSLDPEPEGGPGTKSSTGYDVALLRWENWKAVNRLLFEAECFEREQERRAVKAMREASGLTTAPHGKARNIGYELLFTNEERAKSRIREEVEAVRRKREVGEKGWRGEELRVRGLLVGGARRRREEETKVETAGPERVERMAATDGVSHSGKKTPGGEVEDGVEK
jgi:hypothetical protein